MRFLYLFVYIRLFIVNLRLLFSFRYYGTVYRIVGKHQCRAYVVRISPSAGVWRGHVAELVPSERRTSTVAYTCRARGVNRRCIGSPITSNVH